MNLDEKRSKLHNSKWGDLGNPPRGVWSPTVDMFATG